MGNIINHSNGTIIINGGNPLPGCPTDWEQAKIIQKHLNKDKITPKWEFDCGFKLDCDGPIVEVSSRFYPPTTHGGSTWDGYVHIYFFGEEIEKKKFDCLSLEELQIQVGQYINNIADKIKL